jgi:Fic family protein
MKSAKRSFPNNLNYIVSCIVYDKMKSNYIDQIRAILGHGPLTQVQLATQLGVTFAALNRWLNGHATPHPSMIQAIERLYRERVGYPELPAGTTKRSILRAKRFYYKQSWNRIASDVALQNELILEHTHNSNAIEGSTLTRKETEAVIFDHSIIRNKSLVEHLEATNHAALLRDILTKKYRGPVTEELIRTFHARLMQGIRPDAGNYSLHQRAIRGVDIALTHPEDIPEEMNRLIKTWQSRKGIRSILEKISDFHISFELIHPFGDGNGRVGRLLMALQCLEAGYPPVVVENDRKAEYYDVLEHAQRRDAGPFIVFICDEIEITWNFIRKRLH